jgi:glycosyltransferase involved in cell wall biosynthesis
MTVLTGIDLPPGSPGGSVELLRDLYLAADRPIPANVFMLADPGGPPWGAASRPAASHPAGGTRPVVLDVPGKQVGGAGFWRYVDDLAEVIGLRFRPEDHRVVHLQHLAFGATPALLRAFPDHPHIALVHGTDLLFAADHPTQGQVLREAVAAASVIVVPTAAMADLLRALAPVDPDRIVHVPWGVPDRLLTAVPWPARPEGRDAAWTEERARARNERPSARREGSVLQRPEAASEASQASPEGRDAGWTEERARARKERPSARREGSVLQRPEAASEASQASPEQGPSLRLLYAGRLSAEKGAERLVAAVAQLDGVEIAVAAPEAQYWAMGERIDLTGVRYLGWLTRPRLWRAFSQHDLLVVPSTRFEAFGLVAVEAQACGLPVLYQPVPGLAEVLGDTAVAVDLSDPRNLVDTVAWLRRDRSALADLRAAGRRNAARFPLSRTARELEHLSELAHPSAVAGRAYRG